MNGAPLRTLDACEAPAVGHFRLDVGDACVEGVVALFRASGEAARAEARSLQRRLIAEFAGGRRAAASRSYAGGIAGCAAFWRPDGRRGDPPALGLDIQHDEGPARFPDAEIEAVRATLGLAPPSGGENRRAAFFRDWTVLEARGKALGTGLGLSPELTRALTCGHRVVDLGACCARFTPPGDPPLYGALCVST